MVFAHCIFLVVVMSACSGGEQGTADTSNGQTTMSSKVQTNNKILAIMRMTLVRQPAKKKSIGGNHANSHAGMER